MLDQKISPVLAHAADKHFDSPEYLYEIKWDGTRCLLFAGKKEIQIEKNISDV